MTTPPPPLFRPAAVAAQQRGQWAGTIVLARPLPMRIAAAGAAAVTLALAGLLVFGEYTRKVTVSGQLEPGAGSIKAVAPQFGRIVRSLVADGQQVSAGQPMFELTQERTSGSGAVDERIDKMLATRRDERVQMRQLQTEELNASAAALAARRRSIAQELATRRQQVALQEIRIRNARDKASSFAALARKGFISRAQLNDVRGALAGEQVQRKELESTIAALGRDLLATDSEAQGIARKVRLAASQARAELAQLAQEAAEHDGRSRVQVVAPIAGTATAIAFEQGQSVPAGATLATVIPPGALEARLMVPGRAVGFVREGQQVLLRLDAYSYQKFGEVGGVVTRVERSPIGQAQQAAGAPAPMYRVTVRLGQQGLRAYGQVQQFKSGMPLEADILQDRRRLIEWMFDPLISAAKGGAR